MKRVLILLVPAMVIGFSGVAKATLFDRGSGLIYDDVLDITWLQDANYGAGTTYDDGSSSTDGKMTWANAVAWASNLSYYDSVRAVTYDDWRLPQTLPVDGTSEYDYDRSYNGSTDNGYNISAPGTVHAGSTGSEMAYMYYNNLGNLGYFDTSGSPQSGWGLQNTGLFINLQSSVYGSGTEYAPGSSSAWIFHFRYGDQTSSGKVGEVFAWAVRSGDVAIVPIPGSIWLLGSVLAGLVGWREARRRLG